ncbi:hypothetical protein [uncultured Rubinisphaera sp.]|uniref:hypothetical protein n=1 Tax=uncultured Rubinisphaera sp. TaxID=1678686 RepID=UPI0030DAE23B|tara:strand:+ start:891 stop:1331 length:441 start_codon:yes stop_codon:yes gene_type:complete
MRLTHISFVNEQQIALGIKLGLDLRSKSVTVAAAEISDVLSKKFWGESCLGSPSEKQCELAKKFGFDISSSSRQVGNAVIEDIMLQLNHESIEKESLEPGVVVRNVHDQRKQSLVISSIAEDGTVYFKGGNGKRAWARSLVRIKGD